MKKIINCIYRWFNSLKYTHKNDAEHFMSQSIDRADFERREQILKYKK